MDLEKMLVSIETNIPELSAKVKRLQQIIVEAEALIEEINSFELKTESKTLNF